MAVLTWKYKMMVQINPRTTGGRPSTKSAGLIFTNLMRLLAKNCSAVFALLKKCGLRKTRPFSTGCECFERTIKSISNQFCVSFSHFFLLQFLPIVPRIELPAGLSISCRPSNPRLSHLHEAVELAVKVNNFEDSFLSH